MPGNNYSQIVNRFEADYLEFEPDILIIYKGFRHYMVSPSNPGSGNSKNRWTRLLKNSSFAKRYLDKKPPDPYKRLLKKRKQKGITEPITIINKGQLSRYRKDLQHLVNLCSTNRITLIVSPFPHLVNEDNKEEFINEAYKALYYYPSISVEAYIKGLHMFNAVTKQIASEHGLLYIDINRGLERSKDFFVDNYHLTRKGAEVVANNFSEVLFDFVKLNFPEATIRQTLAY
jgi:lysophospholipase L1-like esterase